MARVKIARQWGSDGDALEVCIEVASSYPDALDQAKRAALDVFTEALATTIAAEAPDPEPS